MHHNSSDCPNKTSICTKCGPQTPLGTTNSLGRRANKPIFIKNIPKTVPHTQQRVNTIAPGIKESPANITEWSSRLFVAHNCAHLGAQSTHKDPNFVVYTLSPSLRVVLA